jgi:hypothetical protein
MSARRVPDDVLVKVVPLCRSWGEAGDLVGLTATSVLRRCKLLGVRPTHLRRKRPDALTPEQIAEARERRAAGEFLDDIARDLHVTKVTICKHTRGCCPTSHAEQKARAAAARRQGVHVPVEIASAYLAVRKALPVLTAAEALNTARMGA